LTLLVNSVRLDSTGGFIDKALSRRLGVDTKVA